MTVRYRTITDIIDPARAAALHVTLGHGTPAPAAGAALPPFWHYAYFWEAVPQADLGRDGHPQVGDFIPDTGFPRRMWSGGDIRFSAPVKIGTPAEKTSRIRKTAQKAGKTGPFAVVTLAHEITQKGQTCLRETQSLVYRPDGGPPVAAPQAPTDETVCTTRRFTTTELFRYSALTFNGHRIHYDRDYARDVEGYPGLVVHGPLLAQHLIHLAESMLGSVKYFEFRATAPLFDHETAEFCARPSTTGVALWVRGPEGRQCMQARAEQGNP
ncbi:MAG: acyl dehydratase [Rhodobacteraceae bacterium]|nr:acyl dehydratase [Paracoccaceae bacterium]